MKRYTKTLLRIGISGALIVYLLYTQDFNKIGENLIKFKTIYLFISLVFLLTGTFLSSLRWKVILNTSGVNVNIGYLYLLYLKGYFYNNFLPTQMGGDVYKSVSLGKHINNQSLSLFSVFMDRFGGLIVLLGLALFGLSSFYGVQGVIVASILTLVGIFLYFPILDFLAKKFKFLKKFKEASDLFINDKKRGIVVILLSILVQVFSFTSIYFLFVGLNIYLPLSAVIAYMPITSLATLIPSFNGFGTQETVYAFLFSNVGVTTEASVTISIMNHVVRLIMSVIGGGFIVLGTTFNPKSEISNSKIQTNTKL